MCLFIKRLVQKIFHVLFLENYIANISIKYSIIMHNTAMNKYPRMDLVLTLYTPYFQFKADRLVVMFHFLMNQNGYKVFDEARRVFLYF